MCGEKEDWGVYEHLGRRAAVDSARSDGRRRPITMCHGSVSQEARVSKIAWPCWVYGM